MRHGRRLDHRNVRGLVTALLAGLAFGGAAGADGVTGGVRGRVTIDLEGTTLADLGPIVVFLEARDGGAGRGLGAPAAPAEILQKNARFSPSFSVVVVGQRVEMRNLDAIYHNVFSYSRPNDFDLGTYPAGESRSVRFRHPGVVKTYCSIHENMNGTILVTPTALYDVVGKTGRFAIPGVPDGSYRLYVWTEKLPRVSRNVKIGPGQTLDLAIPLVGG